MKQKGKKKFNSINFRKTPRKVVIKRQSQKLIKYTTHSCLTGVPTRYMIRRPGKLMYRKRIRNIIRKNRKIEKRRRKRLKEKVFLLCQSKYFHKSSFFPSNPYIPEKLQFSDLVKDKDAFFNELVDVNESISGRSSVVKNHKGVKKINNLHIIKSNKMPKHMSIKNWKIVIKNKSESSKEISKTKDINKKIRNQYEIEKRNINNSKKIEFINTKNENNKNNFKVSGNWKIIQAVLPEVEKSDKPFNKSKIKSKIESYFIMPLNKRKENISQSSLTINAVKLSLNQETSNNADRSNNINNLSVKEKWKSLTKKSSLPFNPYEITVDMLANPRKSSKSDDEEINLVKEKTKSQKKFELLTRKSVPKTSSNNVIIDIHEFDNYQSVKTSLKTKRKIKRKKNKKIKQVMRLPEIKTKDLLINKNNNVPFWFQLTSRLESVAGEKDIERNKVSSWTETGKKIMSSLSTVSALPNIKTTNIHLKPEKKPSDKALESLSDFKIRPNGTSSKETTPKNSLSPISVTPTLLSPRSIFFNPGKAISIGKRTSVPQSWANAFHQLGFDFDKNIYEVNYFILNYYSNLL